MRMDPKYENGSQPEWATPKVARKASLGHNCESGLKKRWVRAVNPGHRAQLHIDLISRVKDRIF